jgi:Ca-activated chloride channel family protein
MKKKALWALAVVGLAAAGVAVSSTALLRARRVADSRPAGGSIARSGERIDLRTPPPLPAPPSTTAPARERAGRDWKRDGLPLAKTRQEAALPEQPAPAATPAAPALRSLAGAKLAEGRLGIAVPREQDEWEASAFNTEAYDRIVDNAFVAVAGNPLSTFSIDVDTASYANVRRFLTSGRLPPKDAVRIEELVNYFRYDYAPPRGQQPFSVSSEVARCPWQPEHRLVLIGLQGRALEETTLPPRNLVFLLDVSGSMNSPDKLPLLQESMGLLVDQLRPQDRVAIVVYAGASGLVLPPTSGERKEAIRQALESLRAGGSTAGGAGIELAYRVAADSFVPGGINRVILATDGDFNVGITSQGELVRLIEEKRRTGVFLSVLGFGTGNLKDSTMEKLADSGNGNYSYIDSLAEGRKVLVEEAGSTLVTIAKDVKIQVEFNPARVAAYRLIGYENRALRAEDFNDDKKDAGEIGSGHSVTALYQVVPAGVAIDLPGIDPLKYQRPPAAPLGEHSEELMTVKLRYKEPDGERSRLVSAAVLERASGSASANLRFAAAVAEFGMLLRESEHKGQASWAQVLELAEDGRGHDREGYRAEFLELARTAEGLAARPQVSAVR